MWKRGALAALLAVLVLTLASCGLKSPEELYALPKPSAEYESLQSSLEELLARGYEYAAPTSGSNTQSVQLEDLDGDGVDEAIAFFRDSTGGEHPLKICIFRADARGSYNLAAAIEGDGDAISSVMYCQLDNHTDSKGNYTEEIVVGWRISSMVYVLSAYSIENDNVTQLMTGSGYTRYLVYDMDQDNLDEILTIQLDLTEGSGSTASLYDWSEEETLSLVNTVSLSASIESLDSVQAGYLAGNVPAVYVTGILQQNGSYLLTDILTDQDGLLANITLDPETGDSTTEHTNQSSLQDINGDNVLEVPMAFPLSSNENLERSESFNALSWVQYSVQGQGQIMEYTYHNTADGWYFSIPSRWEDPLTQGELVLSRSDVNVGATVERSVTFYHQTDSQDPQPEPFLTIYKNTGTNRTSRAAIGDRFLLADDGEATYAAELTQSDWDSGLDADQVLEYFHLILTNWSTE